MKRLLASADVDDVEWAGDLALTAGVDAIALAPSVRRTLLLHRRSSEPSRRSRLQLGPQVTP